MNDDQRRFGGMDAATATVEIVPYRCHPDDCFDPRRLQHLLEDFVREQLGSHFKVIVNVRADR